jgi:hypothetical protein
MTTTIRTTTLASTYSEYDLGKSLAPAPCLNSMESLAVGHGHQCGHQSVCICSRVLLSREPSQIRPSAQVDRLPLIIADFVVIVVPFQEVPDLKRSGDAVKSPTKIILTVCIAMDLNGHIRVVSQQTSLEPISTGVIQFPYFDLSSAFTP